MFLKLDVYVDDAQSPIALEEACVHLYNLPDLIVYLEKNLHRPPLLISYWNPQREQYELLTSLQCLQPKDNNNDNNNNNRVTNEYRPNRDETITSLIIPAHLWVETRPLQLNPVDPDMDTQEYEQLQAHVERWAGNAFIIYSLQSALRISSPCFERLFDYTRNSKIIGDSEHVELLYYTNNSLSSNEVLQRGFDKGGENSWIHLLLNSPSNFQGNASNNSTLPLFVFSSSMTDKDEKEVFSSKPHKVILCEVAPGRVCPSNYPLSKNLDSPPPGYDSICYRENRESGNIVKNIRIGWNHQALPRYVLTLVGKKYDKKRDHNNNYRGVRFHSTNSTHSPSKVDISIKRSSSLSELPNKVYREGNFTNRALSRRDNTSSSLHETSIRSGSAPSLAGKHRVNSFLSSNLTCSIHSEILLGLWCFTCNHLICPYCASVGEHKGHDVTDAENVAVKLSKDVQSLCHNLSTKLDNYQRIRLQLKSEQKELEQKRNRALKTLESTFAELHKILDNKKGEWISRMDKHTNCLDEPIKEVTRLMQQYKETISRLENLWKRASNQFNLFNETPNNNNNNNNNSPISVSVAYLAEAPKLLEEGLKFASQSHDTSLELAINTAKKLRASESNLFQIDYSLLRQSIKNIFSEKDKFHSNTSVTISPYHPENSSILARVSTSPGASTRKTSSIHHNTKNLPLPQRSSTTNTTSASSPLLLYSGGRLDESPCEDPTDNSMDSLHRQQLLRRVMDLRKGYIWCVNNASKYFHPDQRRAVCSGPFRLLGVEWDLRMQSPDNISGNSYTIKETSHFNEDELVGIFLYPIGHSLRVDYRIIFFSAIFWAEWEVSGWAATFAGKGWGIYPLLPRRELIQTDRLACENTLKICVVPTSGAY